MACQASGNNFLFTFEASYVLTLSNNIRDLIFKRGSFGCDLIFQAFLWKNIFELLKKEFEVLRGKDKRRRTSTSKIILSPNKIFFRSVFLEHTHTM